MNAAGKVRASHLERRAFLYIRQSTLRQVFENAESTKRQYALRQQAVALGWPDDRIVVVDSDLGQSGASAKDRIGFQKLVAEVSLGNAGIVLGLEVSRLARSSSDWSRLLEICALTDTLILDEDGIYDPNDFNDRLLLGLKGTMSEAELHFLKARMRGGLLNKAKRGDLKSPLPIGFVYRDDDKVVLDPDLEVQESIRLFFRTFRRTGSARMTMKEFDRQGLRFPMRLGRGYHQGELAWVKLVHSRTLQMLHNPRYAGAFCYGKSQVRRTPGGPKSVKLPQEEWHVLIRDAHDAYISFEEYEDNQRILLANAHAQGPDRLSSPPREGSALLQGMVVCGVCGGRMTVRYHTRNGRAVPDYLCQRSGIEHGVRPCQAIPGSTLDAAISQLLLQTITPLALEVSLAVQNEIEERALELDKLHRQHMEHLRYEAELAKRRYMRVDPDNRLVAMELESDWNARLRDLDTAREEHERQCRTNLEAISEDQRSEIREIAADFPELWNNMNVPDRERKRILRLILEDVTLIKRGQITAQVRFKGGATQTLTLPIPPRSFETWQTDRKVVELIDKLLGQHTDGEIAAILNEQALCSGSGLKFTRRRVASIRRYYGIEDRYTRLKNLGLLSSKELSSTLGVTTTTIKRWEYRGLLQGYRFNDKNESLYERPDQKQLDMLVAITKNRCPLSEEKRGAV
jgi:DNA invertase Pin-like site-specific DNA recombinase